MVNDGTVCVIHLEDLTDGEVWEHHMTDRLRRSHDWSDLYDGGNAGRIRQILVDQLTRVNDDMSIRRANLDAVVAENDAGRATWSQVLAARAEYESWRKAALMFKRLVESRLYEAKQAYRRQLDARDDSNLQAYRAVIRQLALAIGDHQRACAADGLEPSRGDIALWEQLDSITIPFGDGAVALSRMLDLSWRDPEG